MAKKRVHELAKELKAHGIEMDNKELVNELQALGYDVKSHSSSLEDDQAISAVEKIVAARKPKPAPPPVKAAGFMVRRRVDAGAAAPLAEPAPSAGEAAAEAPEGASASAVASHAEAEAEHGGAEEAAPEPAAAAMAAQPHVGEPTIVQARGPMGSVQVAAGGANQRPTPTRAVVVSRPLIPIKRVTPPSTAHKNIPVAPGQRAIGEVKEFKVVPDLLGRGRDFIDVTKDKAGAGRKRTKEAVKENLSKQEIMDLARGRATLPLRGKKKKPTKKGNKTQITEMAAEKKVVKIEEAISLSDLSQQMGVKATDLIRKLMALGTMATVNQMLDPATAELLAGDYGWKVEKVGFEEEAFLAEQENRAEDMQLRPPVVTVMGHVDHGKTSLLDAIRSADVAGGEAGGITQHIGAYSVMTPKGPITFLDTPGHEAFTAMRARGAKITDIVVLVVAADDGVMPQTIEAINHAKAAEVPMIVAINKVDKPGAEPQRVKQALTDQGLVAEDWGGDTIMVPVSARTKQGIDHLLEMIALQAEVLELRANPTKMASGAIIEAKLDKGRGPVATVLVQDGALKLGDAVVSGTISGKVRAMVNDKGESVAEVGAGFPVEVLGLSGVPIAGDDFNVVADEKTAKEIAEHRELKERQKAMATTSKAKLEDLFARIAKGEAKELKVVIKGDVQGSVEAVSTALEKLSTPKVKVVIIHKAVGGINESDVMLASASDAIIVGFNAKPESTAANIASQQDVQIKQYSIIYEAVDEVKLAMEGLLEPIRREKPLGRAEVRQLFVVPKLGTIAGVAVLDGKITRTAMLRLLRDNKVAHTGKIKSLRRMKDDVREVASGFECGVGIENFNDIKQGDVIEAYEIEEIRQSLS